MSDAMVSASLKPNLAEIEERLLGGTTQRRGEAVFARGEGCWLWDTTGKRYLDLTAAQGVAMLGHSHPVLSAALAKQAQTLVACPNFLYNDTRALFAAKLAEVLPAHLNHIFLANSGAEAIDGGLKFARLVTERTGIIATMRSFHGRTIGAVSMTWEPKYRKPFEPLLDVTHVPYNNLEKLDTALDERIGVVVLETVQGEGGVNVGEAEFLQGAEKLCRERGALLMIDEIQTGFGRTGKWFGHQHFGLQPDMICMAKGIGGGFPMGAIAYSDRVNAVLYQGAHGSTFGGNPLASAAGLAAIQVYQDEKVIEHAAEMGELLFERLNATLLDRMIVREIRGTGLMVGIELREKAGRYIKTLMDDYGVLVLPAGSNVIRLLPPLIITRDELEIGIQALAGVLPA
jgi:LysW-gamma-L-lysine/LysW-L-ornithine aminotransferase